MNTTNKHCVFTGIEARLKNYGVQLIATGPEENEVPVHVEGSDIREQYGCNPAAFLEAYGDNESVLFDLFHSVYGISYAD